MHLILFLLACAGMCLILTSGTIFFPLKLKLQELGWNRLVGMLNCSQCVGFHCGWSLGLLLDPCPGWGWLPARLFAYACASSLTSMAADMLLSYINILSEGAVDE